MHRSWSFQSFFGKIEEMNKKEKLVRSKYDLAMLVCAGLETFIFAGITFGWPNLVRIFKQQNYFMESCPTPQLELLSNSTTNNASLKQDKRDWICSNQDDMFGLVYNVASSVTGIGNMAIGLAVDRLPVIVTRIMFIFLFLIGSLCVASSSSETGALLIPGIMFIRIAGYFMHFSNLRLANFAPKVKSTIISIYAGMFGSSSSIFYLVLVAHNAGFKVQSSFFVYAGALCIPFITTFLLFPTKLIDSDGKCQRFPEIACSAAKEKRCEKIFKSGTMNTSTVHKSNDVNANVPDTNAKDITLSYSGMIQHFLIKQNMTFFMDKNFYFLLFLLCILIFRLEFFIISYDAAVVNSVNGDQSLIDHYSAVYGIMQFFAFLVAPISGIIIDYSRSRGNLKAYVWEFAFILFLGILLSACSFIKNIQVYYASNVIFLVFKPLTYSIAMAYICDTYSVKMFGTILGTCQTIAYLLSLLQYPLLTWSNGLLHQDYRVANGIILILCVLAMSHPINLFLRYRSLERSISEEKKNGVNFDGVDKVGSEERSKRPQNGAIVHDTIPKILNSITPD